MLNISGSKSHKKLEKSSKCRMLSRCFTCDKKFEKSPKLKISDRSLLGPLEFAPLANPWGPIRFKDLGFWAFEKLKKKMLPVLFGYRNVIVRFANSVFNRYFYRPRKVWILKWYYDENHIFPIWAILKHKQVDFMSRKNAVYWFIYLFIPEIFKFLKCAN